MEISLKSRSQTLYMLLYPVLEGSYDKSYFSNNRFSRDVMGRFVCNGLDEAMQSDCIDSNKTHTIEWTIVFVKND